MIELDGNKLEIELLSDHSIVKLDGGFEIEKIEEKSASDKPKLSHKSKEKPKGINIRKG